MIKIAVIDDDRDVLDLFSNLLADSEYHVDTAQTPDAFLTLIRNARYDVVIVDFWLGHETALDLLDRLDTEAPGLPTILVSGGGGGHSAEIAEALGNVSGIKAFLHKPFRREELIRVLRQFAA